MDATLVWTVVGSGAGVAGVAVAVGIAVVQARSVRKHPPSLLANDRVSVVLESPSEDAVDPAGAVLRAPTGRLPEHVRGHGDLLPRLRDLAEAPDGRAHVLVGLGGTGKSTIALWVAEEMTRLGRSVWWVSAIDAKTVTAKLLSLARELGAPPAEMIEAQSGQRDAADLLWRFLAARSGWLLIFDNADDLSVLRVNGNDVSGGAGWIRSAASGLILITSRESDPEAWGRHAELHPVRWLDAAYGGQMLKDLAPNSGSLTEAAALSERLGGLPLALHHAGSQLASEFAVEQTFKDYTRALDVRFEPLMGRGVDDDRAIVTRTWELSLDALAAKGRPQARPLLRVLSCLAPAVLIPAILLDLEVLKRVCNDGQDDASEGLAALSSVGLITVSPNPEGTRLGVTVHPLVAETNRLYLDGENPAQVGAVAVGLLSSAAAHLSHQTPEYWPAWLQLVPHLNSVYSYIATRLTDDDMAALTRVSGKAALAFLWAGSYLAAQELAESALQYAAHLGLDHEDVLSLRDGIASANRFRGRYAEAERQYRGILADEMRVFGPDHPYTLDTRFEIARVLARQGLYQQAEREYRDILTARLRMLGPDDPSTLSTRHDIASVLATQGLYEQAEQEYRDILADQLRILGTDHPSTLVTRQDIASVLVRQGLYEQAEREYRDLLADQLRILGPEHPSTRITQDSLRALETHM
jgi:tetratricopeptide (TPR) repeat protein